METCWKIIYKDHRGKNGFLHFVLANVGHTALQVIPYFATSKATPWNQILLWNYVKFLHVFTCVWNWTSHPGPVYYLHLFLHAYFLFPWRDCNSKIVIPQISYPCESNQPSLYCGIYSLAICWNPCHLWCHVDYPAPTWNSNSRIFS